MTGWQPDFELDQPSLDVKVYKRPDGRVVETTIYNIRQEDADWFRENNVAVSMEDLGGDFAVYADVGRRLNDDPNEDPDEVIVFAAGRSCEDTMAELRARAVLKAAGQ